MKPTEPTISILGRGFCGTLVLLTVFAVPALAQTTARMAGIVTSQDGAPAAGVTVRLETADERGATVESTSNKKGHYLIGMIRPGAYVLRVETHSQAIFIRAKGKGVDADAGRATLWEIDREVATEQPVKVNIGARNQIDLDIVVGEKTLARPPPEGDARAVQDAFDRGLASVRDEKFAEGLAILEPLTEKAPDQASLWYLIAFSRERLKRFEAALPAADRVLSLDPSIAGIHVLRGRILRGLARLPEAEGEFRKEIEANAAPSVVFESWVALSTIFKDSNRPSDAIEALEQAVRIDPSQKDLLLELARLYTSTGSPDKAASSLERAERAGGADDTSTVNLAVTFLNQNQYDRAEVIAKRVIEKGSANSNLAVAHSVLARCDLHNSKKADAITHLEAALTLDPTSALAAENRSILAAIKK